MKNTPHPYKKLLVTCLIALSFTASLQAQVQHSGWLASFNTFRIADKWSLHFDAQLRSTDALQEVQTVLLRPGINYHLKNGSVSAGYGFIHNRRSSGGVTGYLAEHRLWQQFILNTNWRKLSTAHRFRFEQRFIPQPQVHEGELQRDEYATAYRLRYFIRNILPLVQQPRFSKGPFFALQNEVFVNTGNKAAVNGKFFDQNRLYAAFGYRLPNKIDLEAGYLNQYTEGRNGFTNNHVAQIAVYKRL